MGAWSRINIDTRRLSQFQALPPISLQVLCGNIILIQEVGLASSLAYASDVSQ